MLPSERSMRSPASTGNVQVLCRFRQQKDKFIPTHQLSDPRSVLIRDPSTKQNIKFTFDQIFDTNATQQQIYSTAAFPIIQSVIEGFNGTIFAYGQTGSGKTHTMQGDTSIPVSPSAGIIPRMVQHLFNTINSKVQPLEFRIKVSIVQLYKQKLRDLLDSSRYDLKIRSDKTRGVFIQHLSQHYIAAPQQVYNLISIAKSTRAVATTNMNQHSSRSHVLLILTIRQSNIEGLNARTGKLYLVDLAGSEKISKSGAEGIRLEEAKKINASLTALGKVINALTDGKSTHIPYRDSKLTRVLQESLGGNSKTTLIVTCSPNPANLHETISTLRFGMAAKKIKNKPQINKEITLGELQEKLNAAEKIILSKESIIQQLKSHIVNQLHKPCPQFNCASEIDLDGEENVKELERKLQIERQLHSVEQQQYNDMKNRLEVALAENQELQNQLRLYRNIKPTQSIKMQKQITENNLSGEQMLNQLQQMTNDENILIFLRNKISKSIFQKHQQALKVTLYQLTQEKQQRKNIKQKYDLLERNMRKKLIKMEHNLKQLTQTYSELMVVQHRFKADNAYLRKSNETKDSCIISLKRKIKELEEHNIYLQNEKYEDQLETEIKKSTSGTFGRTKEQVQRKGIATVMKVITTGKINQSK